MTVTPPFLAENQMTVQTLVFQAQKISAVVLDSEKCAFVIFVLYCTEV
jgi:hypothetical protein